MNVIKTSLPGVLIIEPKVHGDQRGYFVETYQSLRYRDVGIEEAFVQDNLSYSRQGVLRGLHFQNPNAQGKLVYVLQGEVYDVAVDIRIGSPTFGRWVAAHLSGENQRQFYVPAGFAHGFCVTSEAALFAYKCTALYDKDAERVIRWNDAEIGIEWPVEQPLLSAKDMQAPTLAEISREFLPTVQNQNP